MIDIIQKNIKTQICAFLVRADLGKSFFTKLQVLRYRLLGIEQYIIDPDREYTKLCESVDGTIIKIGPTSNTYINILDIREESIEEQDEVTLPGMGVFFEIVWQDSSNELKNQILNIIKNRLHN